MTPAGGYRSLRKPFRVGDSGSYTLPPAIGPIQWSMNDGALVVSWTDRPQTSRIFATSLGLSSDGTHTAANVLQLSENFLAATAITEATYAIDLPDYKPEWKIDFARQHRRALDVQTVTPPQNATNWKHELINLENAPALLQPRAPRQLDPARR
jgi:hypothetical protein